jgi:hypothetical protein
MDLPQYLQGLSFRFVQPEQERTLGARAVAALARLRLPLDSWNTRLPFDRADTRVKLRRTRLGSAGRPLALRALVNRGVTHLAEREAFVAFGLGDGGALLAAIAGNADKLCIGVHEHDAPQVAAAGPARDEFLRRFDELADDERHFIEPGFSRCLARLDERTIGVCFVSALSHEPIAERLAQCEPHLAENAYLLVDNCNCERTRQLTLDFMAASRNQYRVLADARTAEPGSIMGSLTWGRGLLVLQLLGRNAVMPRVTGRGTPPVLAPAA